MGPVIFLGESPLCVPIIENLARLGFSEVAFLDLGNSKILNSPEFEKATSSLLGVKFSTVDSANFIQSQTEYAYCFVMEKNYSQQVLEDMSYFHFLSPRSSVFDVSGGSNFLFEEVALLGVSIISHKDIFESQFQIYKNRVRQRLDGKI